MELRAEVSAAGGPQNDSTHMITMTPDTNLETERVAVSAEEDAEMNRTREDASEEIGAAMGRVREGVSADCAEEGAEARADCAQRRAEAEVECAGRGAGSRLGAGMGRRVMSSAADGARENGGASAERARVGAERADADVAFERLKPRSDSILDGLPAELREEMDEWLDVENLSYTEVQQRLAERGVVTSRSSLSRYYRRWIVPRRYAASLGLAEEICAQPEGKIGEAVRRIAEQQVFEALMQPAPDVKRARVWMQIVDVLHRRKIAEARLKLDERRVVVREKMEAAANPPPEAAISDDEKARLLRELFAMG